jgi:hypothetical protein
MEQSFKLADIPNSFTFYLRNEPIIVINEDGFKYKGELIEDGGEIYKLLNEFLRTPQLPKHPPVFSENGNELFFDEEGNLIKELPQQETLYTKEDVLKAGEIGEINHHDYKHIASLLDEAKAINQSLKKKQ